jgi:hypothetical protein
VIIRGVDPSGFSQTFDVVFLYLLAGIAFWYAVKEQLRTEFDTSQRTRRVTISDTAKELLCAAAAPGWKNPHLLCKRRGLDTDRQSSAERPQPSGG